MKKFWGVLSIFIFILIPILLMSGCATAKKFYNDENFFGEIESTNITRGTARQDIKEWSEKIENARGLIQTIGLGGDTILVEIAHENKLIGNFEGGFLTGTSGHIETYSYVIFRWKSADGRSFYCELPKNKIALNNTDGKPTLHIIFDANPPQERCSCNRWWDKNFEIYKKRPPDFVKEENIFLATIKISDQDIEKYLAFK